MNYSNKHLVLLWALLQHIFAEIEKKFLHSWSFACWRSQNEDQSDASSSFPGLPLVQGQGDGEEHKSRKVSYWKVEKHQELKTGQQVFTLSVNTCVFRLSVEEFLCSSSDLICSNCASWNRSAAHIVTDFSEKCKTGRIMSHSQFVWVAAARLAQDLEHEGLVFFFSYRKVTLNVLECKPPWDIMT